MKHAICPQISSYKEVDEMDYLDVKLKMECMNAESQAAKANQQSNDFYAREGMKRL